MKIVKKLLIFVLIILGIVIMDKYTFTNTWKTIPVPAARDYYNGSWRDIGPIHGSGLVHNSWHQDFNLGERPLGNSRQDFLNKFLIAFAGYHGNNTYNRTEWENSWARQYLIANGVTFSQFENQFILGKPRQNPYSYFMQQAVAIFYDMQEYVYTNYFNRNRKPGDYHTNATIHIAFKYQPIVKQFNKILNIQRKGHPNKMVNSLYPAKVDDNIYNENGKLNELTFEWAIIVDYEHWIINDDGDLELEYTSTKTEEGSLTKKFGD